MRRARALVLTVGLATAALQARDAAACGGCFVSESEVTQITGEKMLLSLSQQQTTLYDQITYSGNPASFAWVLPIHGVATVGLSSDALFQNLDVDTAVTIAAPQLTCPSAQCGAFLTNAGASGAVPPEAPSTVTVIAEQVVGPYETVQLASTDPTALSDWLTSHGYNISAADAAVVAAYVSEGFNFLALKLVPGEGVNSMQPVRVTTTGASPSLPLRMVAVGTGALTPINLWVLAEGRYETVNAPTLQIDPTQVVWDWDSQSSNYATLKQTAFTSSNNAGWVVEDAEPFSMYELQDQLNDLVTTDPTTSGYADSMGNGAPAALAADMAVLFAGLDPSSVWITRFEGLISHAALSADLQIAASSDQSVVSNYITATQTTGTAPACPPVQTCGGSGSGTGWTVWGSGGSTPSGSSSGCAMTSREMSGPCFGGGALLAALAVLRTASVRRRRRRAR